MADSPMLRLLRRYPHGAAALCREMEEQGAVVTRQAVHGWVNGALPGPTFLAPLARVLKAHGVEPRALYRAAGVDVPPDLFGTP